MDENLAKKQQQLKKAIEQLIWSLGISENKLWKDAGVTNPSTWRSRIDPGSGTPTRGENITDLLSNLKQKHSNITFEVAEALYKAIGMAPPPNLKQEFPYSLTENKLEAKSAQQSTKESSSSVAKSGHLQVEIPVVQEQNPRAKQNPPEGTITFLFTDIEGSTKRWETFQEAMSAAIRRHDELLGGIIEANQGYVFKTVGDAFCAAFGQADNAVRAALAIQRATIAEKWPSPIDELKVRIGLHSGSAELRNKDYFGPTVNRVARIQGVAYGTQVLISGVTKELLSGSAPKEITFKDLGRHSLKDLSEPVQIYQLLAPGLPDAFPELKSLTYLPQNLPQQLTSFVGREKEIKELQEILQIHRLVTLTGMGGIGKTRLSLQVAAEMIDQFKDGVWFVELYTLQEQSQEALLVQIAKTIPDLKSVAEMSKSEQIKHWLKTHQVLLILDNCEHLRVTVASLVDDLLRESTKLFILASSREPLDVTGEQNYKVLPLSFPKNDNKTISLDQLKSYDAIRLFLERAQNKVLDFKLAPGDIPKLIKLCQQLEGLPLGLELTAKQAATKDLTYISEGLSKSLDKFKGAITLPPRQKSLQSSIDWSYDALSTPEKTLLNRLAIFNGSWDLKLVEETCTDDYQGTTVASEEVDDLHSALVDKSLIQSEERLIGPLSEQVTVRRYRLLEFVRQYAQAKLIQSGSAEYERLRKRHALYYVKLVEEKEPDLTGPEQERTLAELELEQPNFEAAIEWVLEGTTDKTRLNVALHFGGTLWRFWLARGYLQKGRAWLSTALNSIKGEYDIEPPVLFRAFRAAGVLANEAGDYPAAVIFYNQGLQIAKQTDSKLDMARLLNNLGIAYRYMGDYNKSQEYYIQSLEISRELNNTFLTGTILNNLGMILRYKQQYNEAQRHLYESLELFRQEEDKQGIAEAKSGLGDIALELSDYKTARENLTGSLLLIKELKDLHQIAYLLEYFSALEAAEDRPEQAAQLAGAAYALRNRIDSRLSKDEQQILNRRLQLSRQSPFWEEAYTNGQKMPLEDIIDNLLNHF